MNMPGVSYTLTQAYQGMLLVIVIKIFWLENANFLNGEIPLEVGGGVPQLHLT